MIEADMKLYDVFALNGRDSYGQPSMSEEPIGKTRMAIYVANQAVSTNTLYSDAQYMGITLNDLDDTCYIKYGEDMLKVKYVQGSSRYNYVFMSRCQ